MTVSRIVIYSLYQDLRTMEMIRHTAALIRPATVVSKAVRRDSYRVSVSPWPRAIIPGPRGIRVPSSPIMGAIFAIVSVIFRILS